MNRKKILFNWRSLTVFGAVFLVGYFITVASINGGHRDLHADAATGNEPSLIAPDVTLKKLGGGNIDLKAYRGQWVLINFWATWCPPCIEEMPSLELFYRKYQKENMTVLAVSIDKGSPDKVADFVKSYGLTFQIFHDPAAEAASKFNVSSLPATFVLNPEGEIVSHALGGRDWMDPVIQDYFAELMSITKDKKKKG